MRSLLRSGLIAFMGLVVAVWVSGFPHLRPAPLLIFPILLTLLGTFDTARCMRKRWDFYHAGVLFLLYSDLMALCLLSFLFLYPYFPMFGK